MSFDPPSRAAQAIYRAIAESHEHTSTERSMRKCGTVYRNIKLFIDIGALQQVHEPLRLDPNLTDHHHLICRCCRAIVDLGSEDVAPVRFRRSLPKGFRMERCEVEVLGICARCRSRKTDTPAK